MGLQVEEFDKKHRRITISEQKRYFNEFCVEQCLLTLDIQALMLFVLNIVKKQRVGALSLFRQQDCGIVYQLKLGD